MGKPLKISKEDLHIANFITFYRLATFPIVLFFLLRKQETVYVVLLILDLVSDVLDGFLARYLKLESEIGARLDSYADVGMYILAMLGVIVFKSSDFEVVMPAFYLFIGFYFLPKIISFIKFGRFPSFHLYSSKIVGYMQGIFFVILFLWGFSATMFYIVIFSGIASLMEQTTMVLISKELKSDIPSLLIYKKQKDGS